MTFDLSFQLVDITLFHERLIPFLRGARDLRDLLETAVRIARVRHRSKAWGLALVELQVEQTISPSDLPKGVHVPPSFDSDLHVWGRPFFITYTDPDDISRSIDRYLHSTEQDADDIVREMISALSPDLVGAFEPLIESELPGDDEMRDELGRNLEILRSAYTALGKGHQVTIPDHGLMNPLELFISDLLPVLLRFSSHLTPAWMVPGGVSVVDLLSKVGLRLPPYVGPATQLVMPLLRDIPTLEQRIHPTLLGDGATGSYVRAEDVPRFLAHLRECIPRLPRLDTWKEHDLALEFRKLLEALHDAAHRKMGLIEASGILSAGLGSLG